MRVTDLKLTNVRSIKTCELRFREGFNLLVGDNGVGKTTVIEALAVCVSEYVRHYNLTGEEVLFREDSIRMDAESLDVECGFERAGSRFPFVLHQPRGQNADRPGKIGFIGDQPRIDPDILEAPRHSDGEDGKALGVLYATNRAVPKDTWPRSLIGGRSRAYEHALSDREVDLGYFASWMKVTETLYTERSQQTVDALQRAVRRFLPEYGNLRVGGPDDRTLVIDKADVTLPVRYLSHGELGMLALVLDLTRRLGTANPGLADPAGAAGAVVLIDEIDLHLHPKWQRQIARKLTETFPRCQFIATTHSPQVIGEVEHDRIQIITEGGAYSPTHSFGVDSSRVLEEIMEADPRSKEVLDLLVQIKDEVDHDAFNRARQSLNQLISRVGHGDPEVTRIRTLLDFMDDSE